MGRIWWSGWVVESGFLLRSYTGQNLYPGFESLLHRQWIMQRYKAIIEYDGTNYHGMQKQKNKGEFFFKHLILQWFKIYSLKNPNSKILRTIIP